MTSVTSTALRLAQGGVRRAEQALSVLLRILQARSVLTKRDSAVRADPTASAHVVSEHSPTAPQIIPRLIKRQAPHCGSPTTSTAHGAVEAPSLAPTRPARPPPEGAPFRTLEDCTCAAQYVTSWTWLDWPTP